MLPEPFITRWRGLLISAAAIAATLWFAASGRLTWYIHPRYIGFTVVMSLIGTVIVTVSAIALVRDARSGHREPRPGAAAPDRLAASHGRGIRGLGSLLIVVAATTALLILPPATLSTATVAQRSINAPVLGATSDASRDELLAHAGPDGLGVREWSQLLLADGGAEALGQDATLLGFVSPDPDSSDVFYVTRFVITHCVLDAQPVGVPVYRPGWQDELAPDDWVAVTGAFAADPSGSGTPAVSLLPSSVETAEMPESPYVF